MALPPTLSPDSLDALTELTTLLSRLRATIQTSSGPSGIPGSTPVAGATPNISAASPTGGSLSLKDVPTATDHLKHKLQKSRVQVRGLPDMDRTIPELEEEIAELENKIQMQREVLQRLKQRGAQFTTEESSTTEMKS
ncbi:unnamed protein product [Parascedosporium putredinis]|uniref:Mediator of RNA polymerase II transcription subunit 9 n=1 Tax=Parascedosporium putredinis TaxID=1442378 RepID=A0A9P1HE90_9PEZI|nr:unnamed protein product [Parascedosporium putredinis]CAI8004780.1 unnamed protein product [Parascedosporium putredinis]